MASRARVVTLNAALGPLDYRVPDGMHVEPGSVLVAPLGLKTSGASPGMPRDMIGIFPVVSETPDRLIAGFNDSHLDFRVVVDVTAPASVRQVTLTTLVKTHNWLGRTYLAIITPFHRLIVPALLRQVKN